jgi:hypothetical protein
MGASTSLRRDGGSEALCLLDGKVTVDREVATRDGLGDLRRGDNQPFDNDRHLPPNHARRCLPRTAAPPSGVCGPPDRDSRTFSSVAYDVPVVMTFDRVVLVLGAVAAILAAWFAYPTWKAYRAKPDLQLVVEPGPATSAQFFLKLDNSKGKAAAIDWKLTIETPHGGRIYSMDAFDRPHDVPGWSDRESVDGWTAIWMATGADDSIGPGLHRDMLCTSGGASTTTNATYALRANGMDERRGSIRVTIGEDPDRIQTIEVA